MAAAKQIEELFASVPNTKQDWKKDWKETSKVDWKKDWVEVEVVPEG
jgi:hypothetical protein